MAAGSLCHLEESWAGRVWWATSPWSHKGVVTLATKPPPPYAITLDQRSHSSFMSVVRPEWLLPKFNSRVISVSVSPISLSEGVQIWWDSEDGLPLNEVHCAMGYVVSHFGMIMLTVLGTGGKGTTGMRWFRQHHKSLGPSRLWYKASRELVARTGRHHAYKARRVTRAGRVTERLNWTDILIMSSVLLVCSLF